MAVIHGVKDWNPFNVDAVGLVTLLGANSLQKTLGRLVIHPWAEYFPLLAGHIIPDNLITEPVPGFILYNATDGVKVDGINSWFSRWLLCQDLTRNSTSIYVKKSDTKKRARPQDILNYMLGGSLHAFLIIFSVLIYDWYSFAAAVSLSLSTLSRVVSLQQCRATLDELVEESLKIPEKKVKLLVNLPTNTLVTVYTTRGLVIKALLGEIVPKSHKIYRVVRSTGWLAFGVFIITLGMACLAMQMIFAVMMIVSTWIIIRQLGCDDSNIGGYIQIEQHSLTGVETHMRTYAAMQLTETEEKAMIGWHLFPLKTNGTWWETYESFSDNYRKDPKAFEGWTRDMRIASDRLDQ